MPKSWNCPDKEWAGALSDPVCEISSKTHHTKSSLSFRMILDLFAEDHLVVIKPHPRDFSGRYRDLFPDAVVLDKHFPSELLPFLYDGKFRKIITIGSTAIDALEKNTEEIIKLEEGFENKLDSVFGYVAAVQAVKSLFPELKKEEITAAGCLENCWILCAGIYWDLRCRRQENKDITKWW